MNFKVNLKTIRKSKKMTQQQLAEKSGINYANICNYEQGIHEPSFEILEKLKIALDCSYDDLLN